MKIYRVPMNPVARVALTVLVYSIMLSTLFGGAAAADAVQQAGMLPVFWLP